METDLKVHKYSSDPSYELSKEKVKKGNTKHPPSFLLFSSGLCVCLTHIHRRPGWHILYLKEMCLYMQETSQEEDS